MPRPPPRRSWARAEACHTRNSNSAHGRSWPGRPAFASRSPEPTTTDGTRSPSGTAPGLNDLHYRLDPERGTVDVRRRSPRARTRRRNGDRRPCVPDRRRACRQRRRRPPRAAGRRGWRCSRSSSRSLRAAGRVRNRSTKAHGRALDMLAKPTRGVTASDLERLACETPGVPIGRVRALPGHHPALGCLPAPGAVTIVVLPRCGDPPVPSVALLAEVRRYLERRRLLGTELHVVGPTYVPVTIEATLHAGPDAPARARCARSCCPRPLPRSR